MKKIVMTYVHRSILVSLFLFTSMTTLAGDFIKIKTPRGSEVAVLVQLPNTENNTPPVATVILAPGQSCNSKSSLFELFAQTVLKHNIALVRLEWSYCVADPTKPAPSAELKNEFEDFQVVLAYALENPSIQKDKIFFAGKSLGSIVAFTSHKKEASLSRGLILLTPLCSYNADEQGVALRNPVSVADKYYPGLKLNTKPILMALGSQDDLCSLPLLYSYLSDSNGNISVLVGSGDHGFRVNDYVGLTDITKTQKNIEAISNAIGSWVFSNQ